MAEFPRAELMGWIVTLQNVRTDKAPASVEAVRERRIATIRAAVKAYEQLQERCVMDRTELSIEIANLRARLREVDPQFPAQ